MAFKRGAGAFFQMDNAAGTLVDLSGYLNNIDFPQPTEQLDVTTFGTSNSKSYIGGFIGGGAVSIDGFYEKTFFSHMGSCMAAQTAGTASFSVVYGPGGSVSGEAKITAEVTIQDFNPSDKVDGVAAMSSKLQVTGAVTNTTW